MDTYTTPGIYIFELYSEWDMMGTPMSSSKYYVLVVINTGLGRVQKRYDCTNNTTCLFSTRSIFGSGSFSGVAWFDYTLNNIYNHHIMVTPNAGSGGVVFTIQNKSSSELNTAAKVADVLYDLLHNQSTTGIMCSGVLKNSNVIQVTYETESTFSVMTSTFNNISIDSSYTVTDTVQPLLTVIY